MYIYNNKKQIKPFFENEAIDKKTGELLVPKEIAFNKVGHAMHDLNPVF